jgi:hypothetical protein
MILSRYPSVTVQLPSRYHFQAIVAHGDTPSTIVTLSSLTVPTVPDRSRLFLTVTSRTVGNGGEGEGRECHDGGLWVTLAKNGNGTAMGR